MLGQVMPMICRKKVTMLFSEKSLGICTPFRSPSSQPRKPLIMWVPKLSKNWLKALAEPLQQVVGEAERVVDDVADDLLDLGDDRPEGRRRDAEQLEQALDDELDRIVEEAADASTIRPTSPPAFLRSSAISARTSSTAWLGASMRSLLKSSRARRSPRCGGRRAGRRTSPAPSAPSPAARPAALRRSWRCARARP